ncbi:hypothetical protein IF125_04675 [Empedobacter stercoris]|uniref:hypothetical protein n=2 Tax=Empedobacter stercoris TaxID=1628248 RepID=UPI001CE0996E|nr:hypothetical protein [Empedobacter stercoris]MCA4781558.1 hypothetical protein [Empedobacter stercoris]
MRLLLFISILFSIAFRPLMPVLDYILNYNEIANKLCINKDESELLCNGFCYLKEEVSENEKNRPENNYVKNSVKLLDAIVPQNDILSLKKYFSQKNNSSIDQYLDIDSNYIIRLVFHPPIVYF